MPDIVNPVLTGDVENSIEFFETKLSDGTSTAELMSAFKAPVNLMTRTLEFGRDSTTTYPRSSRYNSSTEEPTNDDSREFMRKYSKEYGVESGWFDVPNLDTDLQDLDLTKDAIELFDKFNTIEENVNYMEQTLLTMDCMKAANPSSLQDSFGSMIPQQAGAIIAFVKSAVKIYKVKVNSYRKALVNLLLPILIKPLLSCFTYLDQLVALSMNTVDDFVMTSQHISVPMCNMEDPTNNTTWQQGMSYIQEGKSLVLGWYNHVKDDIERTLASTTSQTREAAAVMQKIMVTAKIVEMLKDMVGI